MGWGGGEGGGGGVWLGVAQAQYSLIANMSARVRVEAGGKIEDRNTELRLALELSLGYKVTVKG